MSKYLITPTLLNAYQYYINDEFQSPADSRAKFLKTLSKEKFEPTEDMQKGIDFENHVHQLTCNLPSTFNDKPQKYIENVVAVANIVNGGLWQQTVKKDLKVGNQDFLLCGRTDVIKRDTVFDIKFTKNYELGKFQDSSQHLIYLYCSKDLPKFQYLISDGEDYWVEDYFNHAGIEDEIKSKISEFMDYLDNDQEARTIYFDKWRAKND